MPTPITHAEDCRKVCEELATAPYVTVDTEFMRESSYWPRLCLLQLAASPTDAYVLDPLSDDMDLTPLWALFKAPHVIKVFHAARQDIEIFYHLNKIIPHPLFDTQVAAMACGFGDSASYETLVHHFTRQRVDKGQRTTDWSRRPLRPEQITYAAQDVTYLCTIYEHLSSQLQEKQRHSWIAEEIATLQDPATYTFHPRDAWKRLHIRTNMTARTFSLLVSLSAFRETLAQKQDVPRGTILRDEAIHELASLKPRTSGDCENLRFTPKWKARKLIPLGLLEAVAEGLKKPHPSPPARKTNPHSAPMMGLLKILLSLCCEEHQVARKLVAKNQDIEQLAFEENADNPLLQGWRREVFGRHVLAFKRQEITLGLNKQNKPCIIPVSHSP